jgi:hypothetical protein
MKTEVSFDSERFRPVLPDESQVNPGRYGAELAYWLCCGNVDGIDDKWMCFLVPKGKGVFGRDVRESVVISNKAP